MKLYRFYKATNTISNKSYIGYTGQQVLERWNNHIHSANKGSHYHLHRAISKYGIECWKIEQIGELLCSRQEACFREKQLIEEHSTFKNGMNMTKGGEGGNVISKLSNEEKQKIEEKKKRTRLKNYGTLGWTPSHWNTFNNKSEEEKQKINEKRANSPTYKTLEFREKIKAGHYHRSKEDKLMTRKIISEKVKTSFDTRKKDVETWNEYIKELSRRVSKPVHTPIGNFTSLRDAVEATKIPSATLRRWIADVKKIDFFYI